MLYWNIPENKNELKRSQTGGIILGERVWPFNNVITNS